MRGQINKSNKIEFDLIIMDALNYCYKYCHVHKSLHNLRDDWTGLYFGFFSKIQKLKKEHPNSEIVIAWDRKPTVRIKINKYYKANRLEKKARFEKESIELRKMISMYGIKQYYQNGYEADDVIAKLVKNNQDKNVLIMSSDKDLFQLLSDNTFIARKKNPKAKERIYGKTEIEEDFNIIVKNYTLYKAIVGDRGDNVFGISRINKMEVKKFVNFIDGQLGMIYSITRSKKFQKIKAKITMNFGKIEENFELVKLYTDFELREILVKENRKKLIKKFERYEMKRALSVLLEEK